MYIWVQVDESNQKWHIGVWDDAKQPDSSSFFTFRTIHSQPVSERILSPISFTMRAHAAPQSRPSTASFKSFARQKLLAPIARCPRKPLVFAGAEDERTQREGTRTEKNAVIILPGLGNNAEDYDELKRLLVDDHDHAFVKVLDVRRVDWLRNAAGVVDQNYWKGTLSPRPTVDWYLEKISAAIESVRAEALAAGDDAPNVTLLAHSAGGWLGRLYLKDFAYAEKNVVRFVSLGSPHLPPPDGVIDQTRGILTYMEANVPGAYQKDVEYVTIAGTYATGVELLAKSASLSDRIVGLGYKQVCGSAAVPGDGVVPLPSAHLHGAKNVTLDGVYHSPLGADADELAVVGGYADSDDWSDDETGLSGWGGGEKGRRVRARRRWYGHPEIVPSWVEHLGPSDISNFADFPDDDSICD